MASNSNNNITPQSRYPGDICSQDNDCYRDAMCQGGICVPHINNASSCNGQGDGACPPGQYCNSGTCNNTLPLGAACSTGNPFTQCGFMAACIQNASAGGFNCTRMYSVPNGVQITSNTPQIFCQSNYTVNYQGNTYCMPGPMSMYDPAKGYPMMNTNCTYVTYANPFNLSQFTIMNSTIGSTCGYSSNGLSYCDQRKGDSFYNLVLTNV